MKNSSSPSPSRDRGCRITEFNYLGYAALVLENDELRITLLPGKGSDVIQFFYKPLNTEFMWASQPGLQPADAREVLGRTGQSISR